MTKAFDNRSASLPVIYCSSDLPFLPNENTHFIGERIAAASKRKRVVRECPEKNPFADDGRIKAVIFDGEMYNGKPSEVFAYIGFPEGADAEHPVPGMVLVHGGAGHAYAEWVKYWVDNGYAAISFDGFGQLPADGEYSSCDGWSLNSRSHPTIDEFASAGEPIDSQFYYFYLTDAEIAFEILRSDERVIKEKIGITGISWGSYVVTELICYDSRFQFAVPVYGSAFQHESTGIFGRFAQRAKDIWEPSLLLKNVETPVLFINSDSDIFFSANTATKSAAALKNADVVYINGLLHSQDSGSCIPEILRFADSFAKSGEGNIKIKEITLCADGADVTLHIPSDIADVKLSLFYRESGLEYSTDAAVMFSILEEWSAAEGELINGVWHISIPQNANIFYFAAAGTDCSGNTLHGTSGLYYANELPVNN